MRLRLLLIDALNLIRRVYAAQPGEDGPERADGARTSSLQSLVRGLREAKPTHVVCVFDGGGPSWRHALLPDYKAGHKPMPEALADALGSYREAFREVGVDSFSKAGLEADDVIGTIARKAVVAGSAVTVLSTDKIFLGLLAADVRIRDHFKGVDAREEDVVARFGVRSEQLADLLALAGDHGNNIAGIPGIGAKTAADLLGRFGSLEAVLAASDEIPGKLGERLRESAATARLCRVLVGLRTDLDLGINLSDFRYLPTPGRE